MLRGVKKIWNNSDYCFISEEASRRRDWTCSYVVVLDIFSIFTVMVVVVMCICVFLGEQNYMQIHKQTHIEFMQLALPN